MGGMEEVIDGILVAASELKRPLFEMRQLALSFEGLSPEDAVMRDQMVSISERAMRQVNDLQKLRKLADGKYEMGPVAVRPVCDEVTRELVDLFRFNRRELFVNYSSRLGLVTANRELLKSVVYNFLLNAVHYSGDEVRSELVVRETRGNVRVTVRDFGPALPMDVWREMKRGWVKRPESIAMRPGSSGLSLYIASKFSKYMHAGVGAVRHRDGTSFYVDLPVSRQLLLWSDDDFGD